MACTYFDIWPKVVRANQETTLTITPLFEHSRFTRGGAYRTASSNSQDVEVKVNYVRDDGRLSNGQCAMWGEFCTLESRRVGESLCVTHRFEGQAEHIFQLVTMENDKETILTTFSIYSLYDDLFELRPFKGDFHIHSFRSDGKESPAYVAGSCRKVGMDFMALTDHRQYEPSLEAMAAMKELETDLRCYPGEEVHPHQNPVHIVNFGGSFSVNALCQEGPAQPAYRQAVAAYEKELPQGLNDTARFEIASSEWAFDQIRRAGGISLYCHPYWNPHERYYVFGQVNDTIMAHQKFDALEVIGGFYRHQMESNALAIAMYQEERAKGKKIPVVGVSDAHGCDSDLFGWYYTVILAKSLEFTDLAQGIRNLKSAAVEAVPGEFPRVIGTFQIVKYVYFLMREFFPIHDTLCREEGQLILAWLAGDASAKERLAMLKGRVPALWKKYWA